MRKVFWDNPYQYTLETTVASVSSNQVTFAETIAFSFSGGQESDKATVNGLPIIDSKMDNNLIIYTLPDDHGLATGDHVTMEIDWPRRHKLMRFHFAAELVLEIVTQNFGFEKVGAHIAESKARIDFISDTNISGIFDAILEKYNVIINADLPIHTGFIDVATQRRFWKIDGFAEVPCGGTHVKSTKEVGFVTLKRSHPGKSIERIEIQLLNETVIMP